MIATAWGASHYICTQEARPGYEASRPGHSSLPYSVCFLKGLVYQTAASTEKLSKQTHEVVWKYYTIQTNIPTQVEGPVNDSDWLGL